MIGGRKVFALIMIRDGSQRIPDKNMKEMCGRPLTKIAVDNCNASQYVDEIYVSTSSKRYKDIVRGWGCKVIDRPKELSEPTIPNLPVYKHAAEANPDWANTDFVVHVDVCKPLTTFEHIDAVIEDARSGQFETVFTVKEIKANFVGDAAVVSQNKPKSETKHIMFGAVRLLTRRAIVTAKLGTWGMGNPHHDLPICEDWEIDVDYDYQFAMAEAVLKWKMSA